MIDSFEISKSDRATCKGCGKTIRKGVPRGIQEIMRRGKTYLEKHYYCYKCSQLILNDDKIFIINKIKNLQKELNKMIKDSRKTIILAELEEKK